jgi:hypothetical protein
VSAGFVNIPIPGMPEPPELPAAEGKTPVARAARKPAPPAGTQGQIPGQLSFDDLAAEADLEAA